VRVGTSKHAKGNGLILRTMQPMRFAALEWDHETTLPDCATAHCSASHSGNSLIVGLCVRLAEPCCPSPTSTPRPSARFRLLAPDSSRSQVEECSPTSQDATRAHRFRSAFRLSLWGLSEFQLWIRTRVLLRRTLNRSLSQLTWPSSISEAQAGELAYRKSTSVLPRTRNRKLVSVSVVAHQRIAAAEIQGQPAQATD
jgi:hypothetical protein